MTFALATRLTAFVDDLRILPVGTGSTVALDAPPLTSPPAVLFCFIDFEEDVPVIAVFVTHFELDLVEVDRRPDFWI